MEHQTCFDLSRAVEGWVRELAAHPELTPEVRRELETHLRDAVADFQRRGFSPEEAFQQAQRRIGPPQLLCREFKKSLAGLWNRPLAFAAWGVFVGSFVLPSYDTVFGYACALQQPWFWTGALRGEWPSIHYELLTLANLLMLVSPWLLFRFCNSARRATWLRWLTLFAGALVWSFVIELLPSGGWAQLKVGCYAWSASFALLCGSVSVGNSTARRLLDFLPPGVLRTRQPNRLSQLD